MQKLWRRDYNFNVNKDQLPLARFYNNLLGKGDFLSFKSTTHDIIEFNPVFLVIVASHIRPRAMIIASFTSMLRISVKDCDHHSQPDVWGNNDRKHRIKPLNHDPVICGPVPYPYTMTQWSVVQCLTHKPWPSDLWSSALPLYHDPVICGPVPYPYTMTQWSVVQCLTIKPLPSHLWSSALPLNHGDWPDRILRHIVYCI